MFSPKLLDLDDPALRAARETTYAELRGGVEGLAASGQVDDPPAAVLAAWSVVHGIATLALTGNLDASELRSVVAGGDLLEITRRSAGLPLRRADRPRRLTPRRARRHAPPSSRRA